MQEIIIHLSCKKYIFLYKILSRKCFLQNKCIIVLRNYFKQLEISTFLFVFQCWDNFLSSFCNKHRNIQKSHHYYWSEHKQNPQIIKLSIEVENVLSYKFNHDFINYLSLFSNFCCFQHHIFDYVFSGLSSVYFASGHLQNLWKKSIFFNRIIHIISLYFILSFGEHSPFLELE